MQVLVHPGQWLWIGAARGGEGKITWMVITNKSGVEKQKKILYRGVIFLGDFSHCGYKEKFEEIWKTRFNSVNLRKKMLNK